MKKVTVGVLLSSGFPVPTDFVIGFSGVQQSLMAGGGNMLLPDELQVDAARLMFVQDFPVDHARNKICREFLDKDDGDYLLFLDADMKHPADLAHRLVAHDTDIVTARYAMKKPPFFSVAMRRFGPGPTDYQAIEKVLPYEDVRGMVEIDSAGAGALLISRRCLSEMRAMLRKRRLAAEPDFAWPDLAGDDWFRYQDGPDGLRSRSEDMWFFEQARACGFFAYLDADCHCGHVAPILIDPKHHAPYADAYRRATEVTA